MKGEGTLRILVLDGGRYRLRALEPARMAHDPRDVYWIPGGEALCQYLLREDPEAMIIARGPLPFLAGNKTTVGYLSPLTGLPHYSFVGGRGFAALFHLGLDALVLTGAGRPDRYAVIAGRAPHLTVTWHPAEGLASGQRSAYYDLLERELVGDPGAGSIFTLGEAARHGYRTANLAVEGLYHAGRGGAGHVFARRMAALVLRDEPLHAARWFGPRWDDFRALRSGEIRRRLDADCERLSRRDGGTIAKLHATGRGDAPTLPAHNARRLGYEYADLGASETLLATREGQVGCEWCQVNCRHWHWVPAEYAPGGRDRFLDDFEPAYAIFAMLGLGPVGSGEGASQEARKRFLAQVDREIMLPLEELGCDVLDVGVGLAALFEGAERGIIPPEDLPPFLRSGVDERLEQVRRVVTALREGNASPALRALGDGPQALVERYPALQDFVFTGGPGTLANPGHGNALWTFLMPFSRFFGHYSGQIYKVPGKLTPGMSPGEIGELFRDVIREMLRREFFSCLGNAFSACAFTFVIFSEGGRGIALDEGALLSRTLAAYGIEMRPETLAWFAEVFWAQSIRFKMAYGWRPPSAADLPARVFEVLSLHLERSPDELRSLMDMLIAEWKRQAGEILFRYGYDVPDLWEIDVAP